MKYVYYFIIMSIIGGTAISNAKELGLKIKERKTYMEKYNF